jgi:hypothetical protein
MSKAAEKISAVWRAGISIFRDAAALLLSAACPDGENPHIESLTNTLVRQCGELKHLFRRSDL